MGIAACRWDRNMLQSNSPAKKYRAYITYSLYRYNKQKYMYIFIEFQKSYVIGRKVQTYHGHFEQTKNTGDGNRMSWVGITHNPHLRGTHSYHGVCIPVSRLAEDCRSCWSHRLRTAWSGNAWTLEGQNYHQPLSQYSWKNNAIQILTIILIKSMLHS